MDVTEVFKLKQPITIANRSVKEQSVESIEKIILCC